MKTRNYILINGTYFNLDFLVSCEYIHNIKSKKRNGAYLDKGRTFKSKDTESHGILKLSFLAQKDVVSLNGVQADEVWSKLKDRIVEPLEE